MVIFSTWLHAIFNTGICHAILDPVFPMLYLTQYLPCYIWHRYLPCCTWPVTSDTGTQYLHPVLGIYTGIEYLHRHLACYTCYIIYDSSTRYLHQHSIYRPGTWLCHTWHQTLIPGIWYAFMWYKYLDLTSWLLTGHYHPRYLCIMWHIHDYHFYRDLTWLLYYYQIFGTPELLYSWTP